MKVRARTDILVLRRDQRMQTAERRFRREWFDRGARFAPLKPGTKKRVWAGSHVSQQLLGGDAHMTVPAGHVLIDPDSPLGQELLEHLDLPPTLTLGGRRGHRLLYRLPAGVVLKQHTGVLTDLDLITNVFVAPGSVVDGHYYSVIADVPVAELPLHVALGLQELERADDARGRDEDVDSHRRLQFRVQGRKALAAERSAQARREKALRTRGRSAQDKRPSGRLRGGGAELRRRCLAEDRDGHRHQALRSLACQMHRRRETFEEFEALVRANPVSSKLKGQSRDWLRRYIWDSAAAWLASQPDWTAVEGGGGPRWVRRWREHVATPATHRWLRHATTVLARAGLEEHMRAQLLQLCELHAQYAVNFGVYGSLNKVVESGRACYFLAYSLMREHLGGIGGDALTRRMKRLVGLGLITALDRSTLIKEQATYYELKIDSREVLPAAPGTSSLSWPLTCGFEGVRPAAAPGGAHGRDARPKEPRTVSLSVGHSAGEPVDRGP